MTCLYMSVNTGYVAAQQFSVVFLSVQFGKKLCILFFGILDVTQLLIDPLSSVSDELSDVSHGIVCNLYVWSCPVA